MSSEASSTIYLGMDVHKDSMTIAVLPNTASAPIRVESLPNDLAKLQRFVARMARDGEIRACYEASGAGHVLHRTLRDWGYVCDVIALSLIPKRPGVPQAREARCLRINPSVSRRRTHALSHPDRGRGARA